MGSRLKRPTRFLVAYFQNAAVPEENLVSKGELSQRKGTSHGNEKMREGEGERDERRNHRTLESSFNPISDLKLLSPGRL